MKKMDEKNTKSSTKNENNNKNKKEILKSLSGNSKEIKVYLVDLVSAYKEIIEEIKILLKFCDFRDFIILTPNWDYLERRAKWNLNFAQITIDSITKVITKIDSLFNDTDIHKQEKARFNDIKFSLEGAKSIREEVSNKEKCDIIDSDRLFERCHDLLYFFQKIEILLDGMTNIDQTTKRHYGTCSCCSKIPRYEETNPHA
jgi:hypothetical protein